MQQLELFDHRRDDIFDSENQVAHYYDILKETEDSISYSEHIDPKKGFTVCGMEYEEYVDVKKDADEAFKIIKKDGIIIFDDFLWHYSQNLKKSITYAILEFLYKNRKNLKILYSNYQIIVQKI